MEIYVLSGKNSSLIKKAMGIAFNGEKRKVAVIKLTAKEKLFAAKLTDDEAWKLAPYVGVIRKLKAEETDFKKIAEKEL